MNAKSAKPFNQAKSQAKSSDPKIKMPAESSTATPGASGSQSSSTGFPGAEGTQTNSDGDNHASSQATAEAGGDPQASMETEALTQLLLKEMQGELRSASRAARYVSQRIANEVQRICCKSDRIQNSGQIRTWQTALARHRLKKCLAYYHLGSKQGRVELHSTLSAIVYRYVAPASAQLGFQARCNLIEDFLQGFYIESLKAFRRENDIPEDYSPRTQLELAEYMAFSEQYAKRRINLPGCRNQQLIVLRAQSYSNRQPPEMAVDIEMAVESARSEEAELHSRSAAVQQVREQMVADSVDPSEGVLRDRVVAELVRYLEAQGQSDCVDYLTLKLQDLSAPEIDQILGLSPRQRDYLQQRFKYHVEKFARNHNWKLVHEWLGADLEQNLGMSSQQWQGFVDQLTPEQQKLLKLKRMQHHHANGKPLTDQEIARSLGCTPKQAQKRWHKLLELAWEYRNQNQDNSRSK